jgi:hypothetical protein
MVTSVNNRTSASNLQPTNNNNDDDSKKTSNPLVKLISNTAYGAVGGAISVALTALPFVNKYIGVANAGMLPTAIGYGAISGAIVGAVMPLTGLPTLAGIASGSLGALTTGSVALGVGADQEQTSLSAIVGGGVGFIIGDIALTGFCTGYLAKEIVPNVFKETAVNTGVKLIGSNFLRLGLGATVLLGGLLAILPVLFADKNTKKKN